MNAIATHKLRAAATSKVEDVLLEATVQDTKMKRCPFSLLGASIGCINDRGLASQSVSEPYSQSVVGQIDDRPFIKGFD